MCLLPGVRSFVNHDLMLGNRVRALLLLVRRALGDSCSLYLLFPICHTQLKTLSQPRFLDRVGSFRLMSVHFGMIWRHRETVPQFLNVDRDMAMQLAYFFSRWHRLAPTRGEGLEVRGDHGVSWFDACEPNLINAFLNLRFR